MGDGTAAPADGPCRWVTPSAPPSTPTSIVGPSKFLSSVVSADEALVAVGYDDQLGDRHDLAYVAISCDAETWLRADLPVHPGWLTAVAFGNDTLIASGLQDPLNPDAGKLTVIRHRGGEWQLLENGPELGELLFGNGVFLATAGSSQPLLSTDGEHWEPTLISANALAAVRLFFDGTRFIAYHDRVFQTSSDGRHWSPASEPRRFSSCGPFHLVGDQMLGFCSLVTPPTGPYNDVSSYRIFLLQGPRDSDASLWTESEIVSDMAYAPANFDVDETTMVAFSGLRPWATQLPVGSAAWDAPNSTLANAGQFNAFGRGAGQFVLVGYSIYSSRDGRNWQGHAFP